MFRPMRRFKQQLTTEECVKVLTEEPRGVLAVRGDDGYPYALPIDFLYEDGKLYFHCAGEGHKMDAVTADPKVSFCVMDKGFKKDGEWPWHIRSVIVFGRVKKIEDDAARLDLARKIGLKYYPTPEGVEEELRLAADRVNVLELTVEHMTGKLVKES